MAETIVIVGGYGVFGGLLAKRLIKDGDWSVVVAGRSLEAARDFTSRCGGGRSLALDTTAPDLEHRLRALEPFAVVDAAGPFQLYGGDGYRLAEAAIAVGAHYLDLSDDAGFTVGITELDAAAAAQGVSVISGCSTVPAISSAAVNDLAQGLAQVETIETFISPGNRAPRGLSVMRAILAQAGKPVSIFEDGVATSATAWGRVERRDISLPPNPGLGRRWASPIGAPDLQVFPTFFGARSVRMFAGLELGAMHLGLAGLARLVSVGVLKSLVPLARPLQAAANVLYRLGSDRGGMRVDVLGTTPEGRTVRRTWSLVAEAGDGPNIPAAPAWMLLQKLRAGEVSSGARPAVGFFSLSDVAISLKPFAIETGHQEIALSPHFQAILGVDWRKLTAAHQDLHNLIDLRVFEGVATTERGHGLVPWLVAKLLGLPQSHDRVPVRVLMRRRGQSEVWERRFGDSVFRSTLTPATGQGRVDERFGLLTFALRLRAEDNRLYLDVERALLFGILPLPKLLIPLSDTYEFVDPETGEPGFSVRVSLPLIGLLFSYSGKLKPRTPRSAVPQDLISNRA